MLIQVKENHIENGNCQIPQRCMIALAIKEADPTVSYVSVRTNGITMTWRNKEPGVPSVRQHWAVPLKAAKRIIAFDAGERVEPFSFTPKLIDEIIITPPSSDKNKKDKVKTAKRRIKLRKQGVPSSQIYTSDRKRIAGV